MCRKEEVKVRYHKAVTLRQTNCTLSLGTAEGRSLSLFRLCSYKNKIFEKYHKQKKRKFSLFWKRKIIIKNNQCEVTKEDYTNTALNKCNESSGQSLTSMLLFIRPLASAKSGCLVLIYASSMATKLCT